MDGHGGPKCKEMSANSVAWVTDGSAEPKADNVHIAVATLWPIVAIFWLGLDVDILLSGLAVKATQTTISCYIFTNS